VEGDAERRHEERSRHWGAGIGTGGYSQPVRYEASRGLGQVGLEHGAFVGPDRGVPRRDSASQLDVVPAGSDVIGKHSGGRHQRFGGPLIGSRPLTPAERLEIKRISNQATVRADRTALIFTILFTAIGFLLAMCLPNTRNVERNESLASPH